ncbi:MAG: peptidoglycan DD-metalloendopeptidase family protein [Pseudomonadota bacterium]|nr:peptidoglycan DD-metalloendopeptidase family protein [Pseudomonadota bacterium]
MSGISKIRSLVTRAFLALPGKSCIAFTLLMTLAGCASSQPAMIVNGLHSSNPVQPSAPSVPASGLYRVSAGDTLMTISSRYGLDYQTLAAWNHLPPPYILRTGEILHLSSPAQIHAVNEPGISAVTAPLAATPPLQGKSLSGSQAVAPQPVNPASSAGNTNANPSLTHQKMMTAGFWQWPAQGKVVDRFGNGNKGIDIAGKEGEPVYAAAAGKVVYSGSGLRGYGNMIIIKHNLTYLSAYAHNSKLLVKEGQKVKQGQLIALMGHTDAKGPELHFEIRKSGTPVDPLQFLPSSGQ